eukprot:8754845-Alexandrium_andersonii.AAC.1
MCIRDRAFSNPPSGETDRSAKRMPSANQDNLPGVGDREQAVGGRREDLACRAAQLRDLGGP